MAGDGVEGRASFADAFSAALARRGLSLTALQRRLVDRANPVSIATLSYWRSGERVPERTTSLSAIEDIEHLLGLDAGSLIDLIPERVRLGTVPDASLPFTEAEVTAAHEETLALLDAPAMDTARDVSSQVINDVDADGYLFRRAVRSLIQSVSQERVDAVTYSLVSAEDTLSPPDIEVVGARMVREHMHHSGHVYACVLQLDEPLDLGGTTMLEVAMRVGPDDVVPMDADDDARSSTGTFVVRRIRELVVWTRFHPDAIPDWMEEMEQLDSDGEQTFRSLRPQASVHQVRRDFGPGTLGARWGYHDR